MDINKIIDDEILLFKLRGGFDLFYPLKKSYQKLDNIYRHNFCNGKSRDLFYGELHPLCANFEGPGTKIDLPEVRNYPPYNIIDYFAKMHDLDYLKASQIQDPNIRSFLIRKSDNQFIKNIEPYKSIEPYYSIGKSGIEGKMKVEDLIPQLVKFISPNYYGKK